jgi:hypothetical protein
MLQFNKEYFESPYYFYLKDGGSKFSLYYSVSDTITESRRDDDVIEFDVDQKEEIKNLLLKFLKSGKRLSREKVKSILKSKQKKVKKEDGEIDELVNADGSYISSNIPMRNQRLVTKNTTDQTAKMTKANQFPFIRVYYGENEEKGNNIVSEENSMCPEHVSPSGKKTTMCPDDDDYEINYGKNALDEVDQSESFGFEETEFAPTYNVADQIFKDELGVEDDMEREVRVKRLGFDKKLDKELKQEKRMGQCKNCFTKRRLAELEKEKMNSMLDEILLTKKNRNKEVVKKDTEDKGPVSKILMRNIESIKRIAEKEGISIDKLIRHLKQGE